VHKPVKALALLVGNRCPPLLRHGVHRNRANHYRMNGNAMTRSGHKALLTSPWRSSMSRFSWWVVAVTGRVGVC
jgi:hypothetical protein